MTLTRSLIFAVLFYLLCPMAMGIGVALAEDASSETAIVRASQSHLGSARATADFQKSQSQLAAESLIKTIQESEKASEPSSGPASEVAQQAAAIAPAAAPLPELHKPAFTIQNDLISPQTLSPAQRPVPRAISRLPARSVSSPTYNQ